MNAPSSDSLRQRIEGMVEKYAYTFWQAEPSDIVSWLKEQQEATDALESLVKEEVRKAAKAEVGYLNFKMNEYTGRLSAKEILQARLTELEGLQAND